MIIILWYLINIGIKRLWLTFPSISLCMTAPAACGKTNVPTIIIKLGRISYHIFLTNRLKLLWTSNNTIITLLLVLSDKFWRITSMKCQIGVMHCCLDQVIGAKVKTALLPHAGVTMLPQYFPWIATINNRSLLLYYLNYLY